MRHLLTLLILPLTIALPSCASSPPASAIGINNAELQILRDNYYYKGNHTTPIHLLTDAELVTRLDRSADPTLDGEYAEGQTSALAYALTTVGDNRFSTILATRSPQVQAAVIRRIHHLWKNHHLSYPKTQALAANLHSH